MKLFRLTNSEIKKTLSRPSLYIMGIFLVVLLVFTAFIYNPNTTDVSNSYKALNIYGNTAEEVKTNFESVRNSYSDAKVGDINSVITFYANNKLDFDNIYSINNNSTSELAKLNSAYVSYISLNSMLGSSLTDSEKLSQLNSAQKNLKNAFDKFNVELNKFFKSNYPIIRVEKTVKNEINNVITLLNNQISQELVSVEGHKALIKTMLDSQSIATLQSLLGKVEKIVLGGDFLNDLFEIDSNIKTKLTELDAQILKSESVNETRENCAKYVSVKNMGERLIGNKLYLELLGDKSDYQVNNLFSLNSNPFITDNQDVYFKKHLTEQIAIDEYLYTNNKYDFEYNKNFSKFGVMGEDASAFDYAFYAMEFMAFFIILCGCIVAATSISGEYTSGTIRMLAVRPYKRYKIISSKFLSTLLLTFLLLLLTAVIVIITGIINYGINITTILTVFNGTEVFTINPILMFLIYFITLLIKAIVFISISIMFSVIFKSVTPAIVVSLIAYFIAPIFTSFVPLVPILTFLPLINIDLFKFFGNQFTSSYASQNSFIQIFTSQNFLSSNIYITFTLIAISIAICLSVTYALFKHRDM